VVSGAATILQCCAASLFLHTGQLFAASARSTGIAGIRQSPILNRRSSPLHAGGGEAGTAEHRSASNWNKCSLVITLLWTSAFTAGVIHGQGAPQVTGKHPAKFGTQL